MSSPSHGGTSTSTSQPAVAPAAALAGSASASPRQQPVENATLGLPAQPTNIAAPVSSTGDITYPPLGPTREESQPVRVLLLSYGYWLAFPCSAALGGDAELALFCH